MNKTSIPAEKRRVEGARERLLDAALDVFSEHGLSGATTRMLADRAGVNQSAIPYHFGGKEGLYLAVAEHIASRIRDRLGPACRQINDALDADCDRQLEADTLRGLIHTVLRPLAEMLIASDETARWVPFIMREQAHPTEAFDVLHEQGMRLPMGVCARLMGRILGQSPNDPDTILTVFTCLGQIHVFRASRTAVLRGLGWEDFSQPRLQQILRMMESNINAILDARTARQS